MSDIFSTTVDQQFLSERIVDAVYDAVQSKFNSTFNNDFIKQAVLEVLVGLKSQDGQFCHAQLPHKQEIINGERLDILEHLSECSSVPSLTLYRPIIEKARLCVTKLFEETHGFLGTFMYIHDNIGICAFHSVVFRRKIFDGSTLKVAGGHTLKHIASYPYYDLSLYEVVGAEVSHLELASSSTIRVGTKVFVAAFPELDADSLKSMDEEVLVAPGKIVRVQSVVHSPFVAGAYACCGGSSGGAVIDQNGQLLGMHVHNLYRLDDSYLRAGMHDTKFPEDYCIKAPVLDVRFLKSNEERILKSMDALSLGGHAVSNISEKSSFGCFLSVSVIKRKLESCMLWAAEKATMED